MSLYSLIKKIPNTSYDDLFAKTVSPGYLYERLWDLTIKLGLTTEFPNNKYLHIDGNVNTANLTPVTSIIKYILNSKIISGNSGGVSDITLQNRHTEQYVFITCKYPKDTKKKSVIYYDVQNILALMKHKKHSYLYQDAKIFMLVTDKTQVLKKIKNSNSSSEYLTQYMTSDNMLDEEDLKRYYLILQDFLSKHCFKSLDDVVGNYKMHIYQRFHGQLIINRTIDLIKSNNKRFLYGCKPRTGKTYICGGLIERLGIVFKHLNVLVITPAPTETTPQFISMFENNNNFNSFNIHNLSSSTKVAELTKTKLNPRRNIFIASKQLLQNKVGDNKIPYLNSIDLIIFDENHYGGTTPLSKNIIKTYTRDSTILVFLTATYQKPLLHWGIQEDCRMYWDTEDEQMCKARNIEGLKLCHGSDQVDQALTDLKISPEKIFKIYDIYPELMILSTLFDKARFDRIKKSIKDTAYGFSMETLFSLTKDKTDFNYSDEITSILRYISGSNRAVDFPNGDKSYFKRIKDLSTTKGSRTLTNSNFTSQLWFLPFGQNLPIDKVSDNLKTLMKSDKILKRYDILIINSKKKRPIKDIKTYIRLAELSAKANGRPGLIILAGNQCTLGITLPLVDVVFLLNNIMSSDKIYQMMYRSMTEASNKSYGFVVDLNINRVLHTLTEYTVRSKSLSIEEKLKYIIDYNLVNVDADYLQTKKINKDELISQLLEVWKLDPINSIKTLLKKIEEDIIDLSGEDQSVLNNIFTQSANDKQVTTIIKIQEDQDIQDGKVVTKEEKKNKKKKDIIKEITFTRDVLPFIVPLSCILTIKDNNRDFLKMLEAIKKDNKLLEVFNNQTFTWWSKYSIIDTISHLSRKYVKKNSHTYSIAISFKMALKSLIDQPDKLLALIESCLKPKVVEKKKHGEVFTPIELVNEMLNKLPQDVWTNKDLTWFDPANGMGNYPIIIYQRLMITLKPIIKNSKKRKKHILENMLYMCELNKKNVFSCKKIFDINDEYKLNLYEGDFLKLDTFKTWGISHFDIIIGNPPYQKENKKTNNARGGTNNNLYLDFVTNSFKILAKLGYLVFIHPQNWRKIKSKILKEYTDRDIIYMALNQGSDSFKGVSVKTDYYIVKNSKTKKFQTTVSCKYKKIIYNSICVIPRNMTFIPNLYNDHISNILEKIQSHPKAMSYECILNSDCHKTRPHVNEGETKKFKNPLYNTAGKPYKYYSSRPHKDQYKNKVILSNSGKLSPLYDDGKYGTTQDSMYILVENEKESDRIVNAFNNDLYKILLEICKWSNFRNEASLISYLKYPHKDTSNIYKYFKLTREEICFIDSL